MLHGSRRAHRGAYPLRAQHARHHSVHHSALFLFFLLLQLRNHLRAIPSQGTDVTALEVRKDIEQSPIPSEPSDPYEFRNSIKTEDELATIRKRKRGKGLERYHRQQNDVSRHYRSMTGF